MDLRRFGSENYRMKSLLFLLVVSMVISSTLLADQVTLKNGDTVSGQVIKKDGDNLTIKTEFMGEVTMPWSAVTSLKSDIPLYVTLPAGKEVNGKISTEGKDLEVATGTTKATAPIGQVATIRNAAEQQKYERLLNPSWFELWAGYFDLGLALARGNAHTTSLTTAFEANRTTKNDKTELFFRQLYATGTVAGVTAATANAARGGISYDHNINSRWFWNAMTTEEYDNFQSLNFRFVGGGALGYHAIKNEKVVLDLLAGGNFNHEDFEGGITRNVGELNFGDDFSFKVAGPTSITQALRFYVAPASGDYRWAFDAGTSTVLHKWLSFQITFSDRFLSNPVFNRLHNDVLLSTGVRATFGAR